MTTVEDYPLNSDEEIEVPFEYASPVWKHQDPPNSPYISADWNGTLVWASTPDGQWYYESNDAKVGPDDWEQRYPGFKHIDIDICDSAEFTGTYRDKSVKFNATARQWEYLNHRPVNFNTTESDDPDVTEVSALLDAAAGSISRSLSALTPEQQKQSLPGELPVTPAKPPPTERKPLSAPSKKPIRSQPSASSSTKAVSNPPVPVQRPTMAATAPTTKSLGSAPEPFDGTTANAEAFWTNLANYYFLNQDLYSSVSKRIASALTHFKLGTSAGEWAKDRQQTALAHAPPDFGTWKAFQDAFKAHFIPVDAKLLSTQLLHTLKMNNKPFSEWYQEWSTHANRSGANDETKMYAFRQNIPAALHQKIIGVSPAPTTLQRLVELAKEFNQTWRMYNNNRTPSSNSSFTRRRTNVRATNSDDQDDPAIALAGFPPTTKKFTKLSQDEKDRRRRENRCLYCGQAGHWADKCPDKPRRRFNSTPSRFGQNSKPNNPRTRATRVDNDQDPPAPPDIQPSVSHLYTVPGHHFDLSAPDPDHDINQDF